MWFKRKKLLLASASPRRRELLQAAGFDFEVQAVEVDESFPPELPVDELAAFLARKKARAARHFLNEQTPVLLAADSVVIVEDTPLAKPANAEEGLAMLRMLQNRWHRVVTGVCLLSNEKEKTFSETTRVFMEAMSREEMTHYLENFHPFDKAGGYGIQEWIGWCKIGRMEGSYANVVGLPVHRVYAELRAFFV